jgi:hypothetical protein
MKHFRRRCWRDLPRRWDNDERGFRLGPCLLASELVQSDFELLLTSLLLFCCRGTSGREWTRRFAAYSYLLYPLPIPIRSHTHLIPFRPRTLISPSRFSPLALTIIPSHRHYYGGRCGRERLFETHIDTRPARVAPRRVAQVEGPDPSSGVAGDKSPGFASRETEVRTIASQEIGWFST